MGLTSVGLLVAAAGFAVAAVVATALSWRRLRGRWWPVRVLAILGCEVVVLVAAGLEVNRVGQFYPTWSSLGTPPAATVGADRAPALRDSVLAKAPAGGHAGYQLAWPAGPGTVWLPPAYFTHPGTAQPVVVVLAAAAGDVLGGTTPAGCVLTVHIGAHTDPVALARVTAARLVTDFGVARHGWAVVAVGSAAVLGRRLVEADPVRFTSLAVVAAVTGVRRAVATALRTLPPPLAPPLVLGPVPAASTSPAPPPASAPPPTTAPAAVPS